MTALYVIGAIVAIIAVRVVISVVVRGTVNAAARPIEKAIQNRSIQNETDRVAQRLRAQQNMDAYHGNPPPGPGQYPNYYQPPNGQYGVPQHGPGQHPNYYQPPNGQYGVPQHGPSEYRNNQP